MSATASSAKVHELLPKGDNRCGIEGVLQEIDFLVLELIIDNGFTFENVIVNDVGFQVLEHKGVYEHFFVFLN